VVSEDGKYWSTLRSAVCRRREYLSIQHFASSIKVGIRGAPFTTTKQSKPRSADFPPPSDAPPITGRHGLQAGKGGSSALRGS